MPNLKSSFICKALALVLCVFLAFEVSYIQAYQTTDQMNQQFNSAKEAYFVDDFERAKSTLESLVSSIAQLEGMDSFKGEVYLLLGAAYEKLEFNNLAIKYFCLAKDILGEGKTIEGLDLNSLTLYWTQCQTAGGVAISVLIIQYEDGYRSYLAGDYEGSKVILERLVSIIDTLEGFESLKGETYLVLGAAYEALKYKELSIKYYCKAKAILGVGVTVDGIRLSKLRWYKAKCPTGAAAARVVVRERRGGGGFIGFLLGLAVLGGLIWYLFINKNSPLKKDEEGGGDGGGGGGSVNVYTEYGIGSRWRFSTNIQWSGSTPGTFDISPSPSTDNLPHPDDNNGWDDVAQYTWSITGGTFNTEIGVDFDGCNGIKTTHTVWVDDVVVAAVNNKSYTHNRDCSTAPDWQLNNAIANITTTGVHKLRHKMSYTLPTGVTGEVTNTVLVTIK